MSNNISFKPSITSPSILIATWFGVGYLPKAPGTWGSIAALPIAWWAMHIGGTTVLFLTTAIIFVMGIWAANGYSQRSGSHDAGPVVIDEVAGQLFSLGLAFIIIPFNFKWILIGFVFFRLFDVLKPWPINIMDRDIKGGLGVMLDDIGAAIYTTTASFALYWVLKAMGINL